MTQAQAPNKQKQITKMITQNGAQTRTTISKLMMTQTISTVIYSQNENYI